MIKGAVVKTERQSKIVAFFKMNPEHLAALKLRIPKRCLRQFYQTQITSDKFTVCENKVGKITFFQVTVQEPAVLVLSGFGRIRFARNILELLTSEIG